MQYLSLRPPRRRDWNKESIKITKRKAKAGVRERETDVRTAQTIVKLDLR